MLKETNMVFYLPCIIMASYRNEQILKENYKAYFSQTYIYRVFFSFQNNPRNLDLSYKMAVDLWDYLRRVKLVL